MTNSDSPNASINPDQLGVPDLASAVTPNPIHYEMTGSPKAAGFAVKKELIEFLAEHGYVKDDLAREGSGMQPDKVADLLLTDSYESTSNKMVKARKMGIAIKTYEDLIAELS